MKTTIKLVLALSLFGSITLADDGNQGNGGRMSIQPTNTKAEVVYVVLDVVKQYFGIDF